MASSTIRSPLQAPNQPSDPSQHSHYFSTPTSTSTLAGCPFRRSRSRVFYDSETTSGTSWQFRGVDSPPPQLYQTQLHLSVLRSPQQLGSTLLSPNLNHTLHRSPMGMMLVASATDSSTHHRSIPSPPTPGLKDDGSDGSRNSTGSSTGSHRSQDSGFSDSGEARPRRSLTAVSPHPQYLSSSNTTSPRNINSPSHQLQHAQILAAVSRCSNSNLPCDCSTVIGVDKNQGTPNSGTIVGLCHHNSQTRNGATFTRSSTNVVSEGIQPIYSQTLNYSLDHGSRHSTCAPSPIPHSGSGCGKLANRGSTFTLPKSNLAQSTPTSMSTSTSMSPPEYGELNGNECGSCSNYIYQEIILPVQQLSPSANCTYSQPCGHNQLLQSSQVRSSNNPGTSNYAYYTTISSTSNDPTPHLGAPICSSTPKRNVSPPFLTSSSRLPGMKKIDNFETLNKNQRNSLDNNNNSNNTSNSTPSSTSGVKEVKSSPRNLNYQFLTCPPQPNASSNSDNNSKTSKKNSQLSLSSFSQQTPPTQTSGIKTVKRGPLPLPPDAGPVTPTTASMSTSTPAENSFTSPSHYSTYASHSQLKSCIKTDKVSPKWKNLPKGYKRVSTRDLMASFTPSETGSVPIRDETSLDGVIVVKSHFENDSMRQWLHELRSQTENECFYMLQTKSIISEEDVGSDAKGQVHATGSETDSGTYGSEGSGSVKDGNSKRNKKAAAKSVVEAIHSISSPLMSIKNVEQMANVVSAEFAKICKNIEFGFLSQVPRLVLNLVGYVEEFLHTFAGTSMFGNLQKLENKLSRSCRRLHRSAQVMLQISGASSEYKQPISVHSIIESESLQKGEGYHVAVSEVVDGIVTVGNLFSQVVDLRLTRDLGCILDTVEGGGVPAKVALKSFANILMDGGSHLCRLASEIRTVRGMLGVILDAKEDYLRILSLRCLATVLCVGEAVKDFDRASGFEIVADFMYEPMYSFDLKIEAVSVLTQATDPWIDLETSLCTLESNLEKIVVSLTNLIPACKSSEEPFLLVVAAISNLTFLEVSSIDILRRCNTVSFILTVIESTGANFSVFVLDHVATILANMAGVESCRECIVRSGGIHALLKFLHKKPNPSLESAAEIMACERVQQKSTIAISRLCTEDGVAQLIMEKGGLHRLIQLSRNEKERNYSDGVLIAALATLRKLVSICGDEGIRGQNADDLIQPRLLDSFLLYSSRQESYV